MATEKKEHIVQMTRKRLFTWALLVVLTMGWMFILGILVGRGTASLPIDTTARENALKEDIRVSAQKQQGEDGGVVETELQFHEVLRKAPPKAPKPVVTPAPTRRPAPTPVARKEKPPVVARAKSTPAPKPEPKPEPKPVVKPAPKPVVKPAPKPSAGDKPAAAGTGRGRYTIQVGAFKDMDGADEMVARLRTRGYRAYHLRVEVPGKGVLYRVRVGAFAERPSADQMLGKLKGDKFRGLVVSTD